MTAEPYPESHFTATPPEHHAVIYRRALLQIIKGGEQEQRPAVFTELAQDSKTAISNKIRLTEPRLSEAPCSLEDYLAYRSLTESPEAADQHMTIIRHKVEVVTRALLESRELPPDEVAWAKWETLRFLEEAVAGYRGEELPDSETSFVFAIPAGVMRSRILAFKNEDEEDYTSGVAPFIPLARYVDAGVVQKLLVGYPPCVIEKYTPNGVTEQGRLVQGRLAFVPIFADMPFDCTQLYGDGDFKRGQAISRQLAGQIITDTANFVRERFSARFMGLGAFFAAMTKYGKAIDQSHVPEELQIKTETGHPATIYLIVETVRKIMKEVDIEVGDTLGVIGAAGSIGATTVEDMLGQFPQDIIMSDLPWRFGDLEAIRVRHKKEGNGSEQRLHIAQNNLEVIERSNIIVSAITDRMNLNNLDPDCQLDLRGKIFIDDSVPCCFNREQIEARGGHLLWVVGHDPQGRVNRESGYNFGTKEGLLPGSNWGCELGTWLVATQGCSDIATNRPVNTEDVEKARRELDLRGIEAGPFQSSGRPVHLPLKKPVAA